MAWKPGRRRHDEDLPEHFGSAEPLVDRKRRKFPWVAGGDGRRFDSDVSPWLAVVNARGPWRTWRHWEANPPYIPMCLSLWTKDWWLEASAELRVFCFEIWRIAAMEDWWGIFWGDPGQLWRRMGLDREVFHARLEWMLDRGLLTYLSDQERAIAMTIRADGGDASDERGREEEGGRGGDKEGERESRGEQSRAEQSRAEERALPPKAAEAEDRAREEQSGSAPSSRSQAGAEQRPEQSAQQVPEHSKDKAESQGQAKSQSTADAGSVRVIGNPSPPSGIRLDPPRSDGMGRPALRPDSLPKGPPARRGEPSLLGKSLPQALRASADPVKYGFLADLFRRLKFPYPMDSPLGRQELGAFESLYEDLLRSGLPPELRKLILADGLDEADKIAKKRKARKRGAVWCHIHNSRVATYLVRDGPRG